MGISGNQVWSVSKRRRRWSEGVKVENYFVICIIFNNELFLKKNSAHPLNVPHHFDLLK